MHPDGIEVNAASVPDQVAETQQLLRAESVTLFEPTFQHGNLVARVDVLIKRGTAIRLIEVKAKGFDPAQEFVSGQRRSGQERLAAVPLRRGVPDPRARAGAPGVVRHAVPHAARHLSAGRARRHRCAILIDGAAGGERLCSTSRGGSMPRLTASNADVQPNIRPSD
jgi:hypothetical protein